MSVDVVLHIGSGKTGTSTIQRVLRRNPEQLLATGHLYPRTPGLPRHTRLGLYVRPDEEVVTHGDWLTGGYDDPTAFRKEFRRRLDREIATTTATGLVLSDEGLFAASDPAIARTRRLMDRLGGPDGTVRLVVYLRRQDDHLVSRYQQVVKMGEITPLSTWAQQDWTGTYDYHLRLRSWQALQPDTFVVRRFERDRMVDGSLVADFLDAAGLRIDTSTLSHTESRNESLGAEAIELLRILNIYRVKHEGARPGLFGNHPHVVRLREVDTGPVLTLPEVELDRFMATWAAANERVAREFLDDPTGELFETTRKASGTTTEQRLDPARLDHYLDLLEIPVGQHPAVRRIAEKEARRKRAVSARAARKHFERRYRSSRG
ncbi:hypothetical protein F0U44_08420 [Nocardioides humilatus]|uniref:Uncharacterized protein n=1 Tax=Nocardioides humilatus TaxID=2607660 RepID=A0A5B1LDZ8_9ACTN|nr:hypothetical protein [Nocardioides humilatus]KAA1418524.1 hypothetical protein F0U44_08420 [Nocardioides humilatus]